MRIDWLRVLKQVIALVIAIGFAVGLMVRANTVSDPVPGMIGPVMCAVCGLLLVGTTLVMILQSPEAV
ncbi:MAG TPA: hypothetical protein VF624_03015 [Tepidisphaeraceae bacterium]|jgi:hypothetical protein